MKLWTKILPFCFVHWYARKYVQKNTLGGREGVWAFRDTFLLVRDPADDFPPELEMKSSKTDDEYLKG